jgi:hypothetical protein
VVLAGLSIPRIVEQGQALAARFQAAEIPMFVP